MHLKSLPVALAIAAALSLALTQTVFASHPGYISGTGVIQQTCGGDLDDGTFNCLGGTTDSTKDVYFIAHSSTNRVIQYNNYQFVSKIVKIGSTQPSYATCAASNVGFNEYGAKKNVGQWFCVLTSEGRYARLSITKVV